MSRKTRLTPRNILQLTSDIYIHLAVNNPTTGLPRGLFRDFRHNLSRHGGFHSVDLVTEHSRCGGAVKRIPPAASVGRDGILSRPARVLSSDIIAHALSNHGRNRDHRIHRDVLRVRSSRLQLVRNGWVK